eukprot:7645704-Pyramimonas_sp.AAC.1
MGDVGDRELASMHLHALRLTWDSPWNPDGEHVGAWTISLATVAELDPKRPTHDVAADHSLTQ